MSEKELFASKSYEKMRMAINGILDADRKDIYALPFWYFNDDDDVRYPKIVIGYNTNGHYEASVRSASSRDEAKWNFAFWLQNELVEIGGLEDPLLDAWFKESPYHYSDEQNEEAGEDDELFNELLEGGGQFDDEFIEEIISMTQRLFREGVIRQVFGKDIPVLIHELEYYDAPVNWTLKANPKGLVDEFVEWVDEM